MEGGQMKGFKRAEESHVAWPRRTEGTLFTTPANVFFAEFPALGRRGFAALLADDTAVTLWPALAGAPAAGHPRATAWRPATPPQGTAWGHGTRVLMGVQSGGVSSSLASLCCTMIFTSFWSLTLCQKRETMLISHQFRLLWKPAGRRL